jgi:hypothetical protein
MVDDPAPAISAMTGPIFELDAQAHERGHRQLENR